jgi:uncharacterized protein YbjT (DUF2867 family)
MSDTSRKNNALFLVGGTGGLGHEIALGLRTTTGYDEYKAMVRDRSSPKALALEEMGWELVEVPDYFNIDSLTNALQGAKTIVSTIGGADMVAIEVGIIEAAKEVGVSLFVPSQFGVDYRRWGSSFPFLAGKYKVLETAKAAKLPTLAVFNGLFSDSIFSFLADPVNHKARIIGDGSGKVSFTRRSDIGYVLAKALNDPSLQQGGTLSLQGDLMSWKDALTVLETVLEKDFEYEFIDPQDAFKKEQELLKLASEGNMSAFYGAFALHLLGEPARGNVGADVSAEAKTYGISMEKLPITLRKVYGHN